MPCQIYFNDSSLYCHQQENLNILEAQKDCGSYYYENTTTRQSLVFADLIYFGRHSYILGWK